jgi:hypothetical protein
MSDSARPHADQELLYYHDGKGIEVVRNSDVWYKRRERYIAERGLTEDEYHQEILGTIEEITGPLWPWQRFYLIAAVSGRGVEWAQTRGRPHYHIVGLPCPVCSRR